MGAREEAAALKFIAYFRDSWPADLDAPLKLVTDDAYYQMVVPTSAPFRGRKAIKAAWEKMRADGPDQRHTLISIGSNNSTVYMERVDYSIAKDGTWTTIPLMAVFEVNAEGKIYAWREYLDWANLDRQQSHPAFVQDFVPAEVNVIKTETGGYLLRTDSGHPFFTFSGDEPQRSNCIGDCAKTFAPVLAPKGATSQGDWTLIGRGGGQLQWVYKARPIYTNVDLERGKPAKIPGEWKELTPG